MNYEEMIAAAHAERQELDMLVGDMLTSRGGASMRANEPAVPCDSGDRNWSGSLFDYKKQ